MIDIKAIKAAAEADIEHQCKYVETPTTEMKSLTVLAICDEVERLRTALKLIDWSNDSALQARAATEALKGKLE